MKNSKVYNDWMNYNYMNKNLIDKKCMRNSSIELLRIISMLMIVFHHFAVHGGFDWNTKEITIPHFWYIFIVMWGKIGVNIFILISGYFLINDKDLFNIKKIMKIWGEVIFYSLFIYLLFSCMGLHHFTLKSFIIACFPITFEQWWFTSTYVVLYLFHPFINKLLDSFDKNIYQVFLFVIVMIWSVIPTLTTAKYQSNNLLWFITLYVIAGYEKRFGFNKKLNTKHYLAIGVIFTILTYLSSVVFMLIGMKYNFAEKNITYFYGQEKISVLIISISLFMMFKSLKIKSMRMINTIASATFGVYLIHDNYIIRDFLWKELFKNYKYQNSKILIIYSIVVVILVYFVCIVIDFIRQILLEKIYIKIVNKYCGVWLKIFQKIFIYFQKIFFGD